MFASIVAVVVSGALAVIGAERHLPKLSWLFKPLTTALLLAVLGWPRTTFAWWVAIGIGLSVIGDAALLMPGDLGFVSGLAAFLLAHVAYIAGFTRVAAWSPRVLLAALATALVTASVLRAIWRGAAGLHAPTVAYGVVISGMVVSAMATLGGPLPAAPLAAAGAALFYASDTTLALNRFWRPIRREPLVTLGLYWIGQIAIAAAARGLSVGP